MNKSSKIPGAREALAAFDQGLDRKLAAAFESCLHCGRCADSCVFFLGIGETALIPGNRLRALSRIYGRRRTLIGRISSFLSKSKDRPPNLEELHKAAFGSCTMCGRCETFCPAGINTGELMFLARSMLEASDRTPENLKRTLELALSSGNNMGITKEDFAETVEWLSEELVDEFGEDMGKIPVDSTEADALYLVNPREIKYYPLSLQAAAKVLNAARESWTLSSACFDVTNYGFFSGNPATAGKLATRVIGAAETLGCRRIIVSECGHGYNSLRWNASLWRGEKSEIEVVSIVELLDEYLRSGRIVADKSKNSQRMTLHDPCNLVRRGGVIEPQRRILDSVASEWAEMQPNRQYNYCCGGGGGLRVQTAQKKRSLQAGRMKAEQIRATGAALVAAPCHNCIDQIDDLNKEYDLKIKMTTLVELVAESLVLETRSE